jgi:multiple sugar transport system permease protein
MTTVRLAQVRAVRAGRRAGEGRAAYGFLTPWLIGLVVITIGPMVASLYLAFTRYDLLTAPRWTGLTNFRNLFGDPRFMTAVTVTLRYVVISVPLVIVVSLAVAVFLNRAIRFLSVYRALFYIPSLLGSSVAIAILWRQVFGANGIVDRVLSAVGIHHGSFIGDPSTSLYTLVSLNLWAFGGTMVIFLAGLRQVPAALYEAAAVDGAGAWRRFWHITLPALSPLIFFNLLLNTVHAFQSFTSAYVISGGNGSPADSTLLYTVYLYQRGFVDFRMGYASAMAWLLLAVLAGFTAVLFASARFWVHYEDEAG